MALPVWSLVPARLVHVHPSSYGYFARTIAKSVSATTRISDFLQSRSLVRVADLQLLLHLFSPEEGSFPEYVRPGSFPDL